MASLDDTRLIWRSGNLLLVLASPLDFGAEFYEATTW